MLNIITSNQSANINEEGLIADIQKKIKSADPVLQAFHSQWFQNIAMRRGLQNVQITSGQSNKVVLNPPEVKGRVRITINRMKAIHQTRLAKMVTDMPKMEVMPASDQEEDKELARKGTKILAYKWQDERMVEKITDECSWMIDCGSSFFHVYWDPTKGPKVPIYKRFEGKEINPEIDRVDSDGFVLDETGQRRIVEESIGDVAIDVVPPFDIVNDQTSPTVEDSGWIIIRKCMRVKDIKMMWPITGKDVVAEKDTSQRAYFQRRLMSMVGGVSEAYATEAMTDEEMATIIYFYEKKCPDFPEGKFLIICGSIVLESTTMPFNDGVTFPIIKTDDTFVSGAFWGNGTNDDLIPIQKGYNRTISQIAENANNHGNTKLLVPRGANLDPDAYDDSGTECIEFNSGFQPTQMQPASLPGHMTALLNFYDKAFEDVSGQHEVTRGEAPSGVKSGRAIIALQEKDDTQMAPTKIKYFRQLERLGVLILRLYEQHQNEDRTYRLIGENLNDIETFKISKAESISMNKDVRVQTENIIASHKRVMQENAMEMFGEGLFGDQADPETRKRVLKIMEFGNINEIFSAYNQDSLNARTENENFCLWTPDVLIQKQDEKTGVSIWTQEAFVFDDHIVHLNEHNRFRKSPRYHSFTQLQRRGIDNHCEQHEVFLKGPTPQEAPPAQTGQGAMPPSPIPEQPAMPAPMQGPVPMVPAG